MFNQSKKDDFWPSISDMMAGLMIVFLFIAVVYMEKSQDAIEKVIYITEDFENTEKSLYEELMKEFKNDLENWKAEIDPQSLSVIFKEPDVLFEKGRSNLKVKFKTILNDFFPRYVNILENEFGESIKSVRIEGHTSSKTKMLYGEDYSYLNNMQLSQDRASEVLQYVLSSTKVKDNTWVRDHLQAVGFSSSRLKYLDDSSNFSNQDTLRSRRVEFKVVTNAQDIVYQMATELQQLNLSKK